MPTLHPTALVDPQADLAADVTVGPYAVIGPRVRLGPGTTIGPHVILDGQTTLGARCRISAGAVIGAASQDLKATGRPGALLIGDDNIIREYATLSCGTAAGLSTRVGHGNLIMAYAHVAHDCVVGNHCVIANNGTLAGHVTLEDSVIVGGLAAVHQFVRIGRLAIVGGCSKVVQDVVPFAMADGHPARIYGVNVIGLRRAGITPAARRELQAAFRVLFGRGLTVVGARRALERQPGDSPEVAQLVAFLRQSRRGLCRGIRREAATTPVLG